MIFRYLVEQDSITVRDYLNHLKIPSNVIVSLTNKNGQILVNDQTVTKVFMMHKGDNLEIVFPSSSQGENIKSVKGPFKIVYEDSYLLIIDKDPNLATIPTREYYDTSLANYVMSYYKRTGVLANIHFVSRLDFPTSGLIMLAKNSFMLSLIKNANIKKYYLAELSGIIEPSSGTIETGIEKDNNSIIKRKVVMDKINSKTIYETLKIVNQHSIVSCLLVTGKTHQLRVHFSYLGYPIIGDKLYGKEEDEIIHLHSYKLTFIHPITKEELTFTSYPKWV